MRKTLVGALLTFTAAGLANAQAPAAAAPPGQQVWSTNPLGFLQLGPNIEFERAIGKQSAFGGGVRLPTLGLSTYLINDGIQSGWTVYGIWRGYPGKSALRGWYFGPHIEVGGTSNETYTSKLLAGAGEFGYRWIKANGFSFALGGLLGVLKSTDTWKDGTGSAGNETYVIWMLNTSFGFAR